MPGPAQAIHAAMVAAGFQRDRSDVTSLRFAGSLAVAGRQISVVIIFADDTLCELPKLQLLNRKGELPNAVAHIEHNDRVCYAQDVELLLNPLDPSGAVARCLAAMAAALDRIARLELSAEIAREFPQTWLPRAFVYISERWSTSGKAFLVPAPSHGRLVLASRVDAIGHFLSAPEDIRLAKARAKPAAVIATPIELTFRRPHRQPTTLGEALAWAASLQPGLDTSIVDALADQDPEHLTFFLSAPNGVVGAHVILPLRLRKAIQRQQFLRHVLEARNAELTLTRLSGVPADPDFLQSRNLNTMPNLANKRVALTGIGTIGGYLAKFLAQSGAGYKAGQLTLFDEQPLQPGNVGRHLLPLTSVGFNKAEAMRDWLRSQHPDNDITAVAGNAWHHRDRLADYDLVINATGDEAFSKILNQHFVRQRRSGTRFPDCLHVWIKGNGVAAQALMVDGLDGACYSCLQLLDGRDRFAVIKAEHPAQWTPANCGEGAYFAYGVGSSAIAAGLGIQVALDWVRKAPSPRFRTLRIVHKATVGCKDQNPARLEGCPACGVV